MARVADPQKRYAGRRDDAAVLNFTMSREYAEKLRAWSGGPGDKRLGRFVEQLARDYEMRLQVREEERQRLQQKLLAAVQDDDHA
jgi:hypothetical protein